MASPATHTLGDPQAQGSILMRSAATRLGGAMALVVLLWLAVAWALL